ncbi:MAG TPA: carboxypeptidase regulatory-like domain-containing protein [Anaerolineales bacterium]|nr:carboxypeptidase regulatory-like domain-containing protein [Anaerolineales bacterium]HNB40301.1 carboxypeptidase regulatory-like domain-containing protein [Anaerolineales bacterium]HNE03361.1 carboxypeptidase regulatory-like domain-containing protein [Anaerolineales bacterium]HNF94048.1 carboxypeptidase regulatory-like domain-containing protein [Anaerolineales bacterium]
MKFKNLFRVAMLFATIISVFGTGAQAYAQGNSTNYLGAQIIIRSTTFWDAVFNGTVNANRYERWSLQLIEPENFTISIITTSGTLTPDIYLLDASENQIASATGTLSSASLTTNQLAGDYFIQVQPHSGDGTYLMEITRTEQVVEPTASVVLNPAVIPVGGTSTGTLMLSNIPSGGYASAEFTCTYNPALVQISNITDAGLFGSDPAVAVNGPVDGSFVFAVAGSNSQRATSDGAVFTFTVTGLAAGQADIACTVRVSAGGSLSTITSTPASLTIEEVTATLNGTVNATKTVTVTLYKQDTTVEATTTVDTSGNFTITAPAGTYTVVASAPGFLKAQGSPVLTAGATKTMQTISLLAGDIDGNDVIDQFDALTIGMNYNLIEPTAADLNNDGTINVLDLELLAANYRASGASAWQ